MVFFSTALEGKGGQRRGTWGCGNLLSSRIQPLAWQQDWLENNNSAPLNPPGFWNLPSLHITGAVPGELFCKRCRGRWGWLPRLRTETSVCFNQIRSCPLSLFPGQQLPQTWGSPSWWVFRENLLLQLAECFPKAGVFKQQMMF